MSPSRSTVRSLVFRRRNGSLDGYKLISGLPGIGSLVFDGVRPVEAESILSDEKFTCRRDGSRLFEQLLLVYPTVDHLHTADPCFARNNIEFVDDRASECSPIANSPARR